MTKKLILLTGALAVGTAFGAIRAVTPQKPDWDWVKQWWDDRHAQKLAEVTNGIPPEVVFVGDSITHFWESNGKAQWDKYLTGQGFRALDLGFSADRTEHVLWRIAHGELDGYKAKVVFLMIGTNNTGHFPVEKEPPADTIIGIRRVIAAIREKQPAAKVVLTAIFPCGAGHDDGRRVRNQIVNREIAKFADGKDVFWLDFNEQFLLADGTLPQEIFPDLLHPGAYGYEVWAAAIAPYLEGRFANRFPPFLRPQDVRVDMPRAVYPATRILSEGYGAPNWWLDRLEAHRNAIADSDGTFDVVFLGDSITHNWENQGAAVWAELNGRCRALNLGYSGDRTEHLLWRVKHGELDGYKAKTVVLMIGTNNAGHLRDRSEDTAAGVKAILETIAAKQPEATVVLHPVFPRGEANDELRKLNEGVNGIIRSYADGKRVVWVDFNDKLVDAKGDTLGLMPDRLHPTEAGYRIWLDALAPYVPWKPNVRWRGVNLLGLFRAPWNKTDPRSSGRFREEQFKWLADWGFNFVRLPIDYRNLTVSNNWFQLQEEGFKKVDEAVEFGRKYGIHVQISLHRAPGYTILAGKDAEPANLATDAGAQKAFCGIWCAFARRYRGIPNERLSFNPVNEPNGFTTEQYEHVFGDMLAVVREEDPARFVMFDGNYVASKPVPSFWKFPSTGQAFRGYTPHAISHYGAPYIKDQPAREPTWPLQKDLDDGRWLFEDPKVTMDKYVGYARQGYPVMVGEFGCYNKLKHETCLKWMEHCLKLWKENNLGWALWNLDGPFGFMDSGRTDVDYEDFEGHKLDRKMLDLLRRW